MVATERDNPRPGAACCIEVDPGVYEQLQAIAAEQALPVDAAAHMLLVEALRRLGRWPAAAGEEAAEQRALREADGGQAAGE